MTARCDACVPAMMPRDEMPQVDWGDLPSAKGGIRAIIITSVIGPKQTWALAPHMSAFGGKADMAFCGISLSRSLLGVKQT